MKFPHVTSKTRLNQIKQFFFKWWWLRPRWWQWRCLEMVWSGCILKKVRRIIWCTRHGIWEKQRTQNNANDFDLSNWKMELPSLTREGCGCRRFGREIFFLKKNYIIIWENARVCWSWVVGIWDFVITLCIFSKP